MLFENAQQCAKPLPRDDLSVNERKESSALVPKPLPSPEHLEKVYLVASNQLPQALGNQATWSPEADVLANGSQLHLQTLTVEKKAKQLFFCNLTESDLRSDSPVV